MHIRALILLLVPLSTAGCGPTLQPEDLGTVETKVPKLPGSEVPFPMPELDTPADPDSKTPPSTAGPAPKASDEPNTGANK